MCVCIHIYIYTHVCVYIYITCLNHASNNVDITLISIMTIIMLTIASIQYMLIAYVMQYMPGAVGPAAL